MGKSWSSPEVTLESILDYRVQVAKKLMHYSRKVDQQPDSYKTAAEFLTRCAEELARFSHLPVTAPKLLRGFVPPCFGERCTRLVRELQRAGRTLQDQTAPVSPKMASLVIEILAVQLGRLTIGPSRDKDEYAAAMDLRMEKKDYEWKKRHIQDEDVTAMVRAVFNLSFKLSQRVEGCSCIQCARRSDSKG